MARNIEIKARARDFDRQIRLAAALADGPAQELHQTDTFFRVDSGRLKLREFGDGTGELIQYSRPDVKDPAESDYIIVPTDHPALMKESLSRALGIRIDVAKHRTLYLTGQTRMHFDRVDRLGRFIELEVVLQPGQSREHGVRIAEQLMKALEICDEDCLHSAYVDMLEAMRS